MAFQPEPFGKYYLIDKIAVGGMAEIFRAKQFGPGGFEKVLVIKRILAHLGEDDEFIQMFRDEAMICSTLTHSNIIHVYDFGKVRNNYFIAMEYCEGRDLKTVMKKCQEIGRPFPIEYAIYTIHEICKGLDYAHRKRDSNDQDLNILHRDISPSNIMISYDEGKIKLADFGIAKAENTSYKTKAGVLKGKFEYMSPEQASGYPADRRSDIFAIGVTFYELLTRRRLFKTDSDLKTLELIRNPIIPPPSHLNSHVTEELDRIVMKALARRPEDRYQEAAHLEQDLRDYMRTSTPPTSPDQIALSLGMFMREIFDREIMLERERMASGTRVARELLANAQTMPRQALQEDEAWDIPSDNSRVTSMPSAPTLSHNTSVRLMLHDKVQVKNNNPLIIGGGVAALVVAAGLVLFGGESSTAVQQSGTQAGAAGTAAAPANPGTLNAGSATAPLPATGQSAAVLRLNIQPYGAAIFLDGKFVGQSPIVTEEFPVGKPFELRVEKEGYQKHSETLQMDPNARRDITISLLPDAKTRPAQAPAPVRTSAPAPAQERAPVAVPAASGRVELSSSPSGATVLVNGRTFCTTPCAFEGGQPGETYTLEFSRDGYGTQSSRIRFPSSGSQPVSVTLSRVEQGYLTLSIKDSLSAELFIDGQQKGYNAFFDKVSLPAGRHNIRLRNQVAGLEKTFSVEINPGQETRVTAIELLPKE